MASDNSSGNGWRSIINSRLAFFRFQALEPVFTPCQDQGCVLYVYKLSKCLCMVYGGYMGNMYICIGVYPYPPGLQPGIEWNWFLAVSRLTRPQNVKAHCISIKTYGTGPKLYNTSQSYLSIPLFYPMWGNTHYSMFSFFGSEKNENQKRETPKQ